MSTYSVLEKSWRAKRRRTVWKRVLPWSMAVFCLLILAILTINLRAIQNLRPQVDGERLELHLQLLSFPGDKTDLDPEMATHALAGNFKVGESCDSPIPDAGESSDARGKELYASIVSELSQLISDVRHKSKSRPSFFIVGSHDFHTYEKNRELALQRAKCIEKILVERFDVKTHETSVMARYNNCANAAAPCDAERDRVVHVFAVAAP